MGYELKLFVGKSSTISETELVKTNPTANANGYVEYDYPRDSNGRLQVTGRWGTYFFIYGMVDLCKPRYESSIFKLQDAYKNTEIASKYWFHYGTDGDRETKEDKYGTAYKPAPISEVIAALIADVEVDEYRRFRWALGFLEQVYASDPDSEVMFYGY